MKKSLTIALVLGLSVACAVPALGIARGWRDPVALQDGPRSQIRQGHRRAHEERLRGQRRLEDLHDGLEFFRGPTAQRGVLQVLKPLIHQ